MVSPPYHDFFEVSAEVAGGLVGLLFVAISVVPHKLAGDRASAGFQTRAGLALSALVNAVGLDATVVVVCFLFAVARAWELLGGEKSGLLCVLVEAGRRGRPGSIGATDQTR